VAVSVSLCANEPPRRHSTGQRPRAVGVQAARAAAWGLEPPDEVLSGPLGVRVLLGADGTLPTAPQDVLSSTVVRPYPVNGFSQTAVQATAQLRAQLHGPVPGLEVAVAPGVVAATTTPRAPWWDLARAVAATWASGDPFRCDHDPGLDAVPISVVIATRAMTSARVAVIGDHGSGVECPDAPGGSGPDGEELALGKWSRMAAPPVDELLRCATAAVESDEPGPAIDLIRAGG